VCPKSDRHIRIIQRREQHELTGHTYQNSYLSPNRDSCRFHGPSGRYTAPITLRPLRATRQRVLANDVRIMYVWDVYVDNSKTVVRGYNAMTSSVILWLTQV
jgi:hypothetical protein